MIDFSNIIEVLLGVNDVLKIEDSNNVILWQKQQQPTGNYFYVEDISGNANTLSIKGTPSINVFYSTDQQNWTSMGTTSTTPITATVPTNGKLYLKATANQWGGNVITCTGTFNVGGNIMSLLVDDNYENATLDGNYDLQFAGMFFNSGNLRDASALLLPSNVTSYCYRNMFTGCTSLVNVPATLPATTLASYCYGNMFQGCTSLTTAPTLPATTLASYCYMQMFSGCTSLTTAPALPATNLTGTYGCYVSMFENCTSLTTAPALPATTLGDSCYTSMFTGCTSLVNVPATLPATNLTGAIACYRYMFNGCTSLTTAPALPATTLVSYCYGNMFSGCTALTAAPTLPATTLATSCYSLMFSGCTLIDRIDVYADDNSATDCTYHWLSNVAPSGDFYNYSDTATYTIDDPSGVPQGWTLHNMAAQPNDEIWYETSDGQIADFSNAGFNATILSNTYTNGKGVVKFNSNVTSSSGNNSTSRATNLTKISFPDSFTSVGQHTFDGCPLTELDLNNITTVGYEAFDGNHIQHLHIPATCTSINYNPFRSSYTTQITVDANNPNYNDGSAHNGSNCIYSGTTLISGCINTVIPDNCTIIGDWSMSNNYSLTTLNLPASITQIKQYAFAGDTTVPLTTVYARSTPSFGNQPFMNCQTGGILYYTSGVNYNTWLNKLPSGWTAVLLCDVTISAGNNGSISVDGVSGNYHQPEIPSGTQLTLVATPAAGYQFDSWSDGNTNATRTITVTADTTLTASFVQQIPSYTVSISAGNNGSVTVNGVSGNYTATVQSGTQLTIRGIANSGYDFSGWSDNVNTNPRTITITGNTTLTASFIIQPANEPFYVEDASGASNNFYIYGKSNLPGIEVFSSTDKVNWTSMGTTNGNNAITATIPANGKLYLKATTDYWAIDDNGSTYNHWMSCHSNYKIGGNIMSLLVGDNYYNAILDTNYTHQFAGLFNESGTSYRTLIDASKLILPSNTTDYCYYQMFDYCNRLTAAPALPATAVGKYSYGSMFIACSSLSTAPTLSASTLGESCYENMFANTSLTAAPTLPATTLAYYCYRWMFAGCTSLTTAPTLIATRLVNHCYHGMFKDCSNLNRVVTYANYDASTGYNPPTNSWLDGVAATGDFYNLGQLSYTTGASGIPSGWTEHTSL